ncbi:MAG: DMT family transporter [Faecousia sp.]
MKKKTIRGILFAFISGVCWGFSGTVGQYLFSHTGMDSGWLTTVRLLSAGMILLAMAAVKDPKALVRVWKDKKDAAQLIFFGVAGLMAVQFCYMQAIFYSDSGTATAVQYTGEAMLLVYTCLVFRRLPKRSEALGLLLALFGIFLLATHGSLSNMALSPAGLGWGLAAAVALVVYTVAPGRLIKKYGSSPVIAYGMLIGGGVLALLLRAWRLPGDYSPGALLGLGTIVLVGTVLGFTLYLQSTVLIGGLKAGLISAVETVSAPLFSRLWLKTPFQMLDYLGFACILTMVILISLPELREQRRAGANSAL